MQDPRQRTGRDVFVVKVELLTVVLEAHGVRHASRSQRQGFVGGVAIPGSRDGSGRHLRLGHDQRHDINQLPLVAPLPLVSSYSVRISVSLSERERVLRHLPLLLTAGAVVPYTPHSVFGGSLLNQRNVLLEVHERVNEGGVREGRRSGGNASVPVCRCEGLHPRPLHLRGNILRKLGASLLLEQVVLLQGIKHREKLPSLVLVELRRIPIVEERGEVRSLKLDGTGSRQGLVGVVHGVKLEDSALEALKA
mmetsp:Transcript_23719/g.44589  ORF Transcript_23719/g.44589 Transcript_23719/m.44589 type:complete len:251 (+) Transcript_23719:1041-1793(+)